jgi:hypothetical protein
VIIMPTAEREVPLLQPGDFLSREEFFRRWEVMPHLKRAELIQGVVYMPSPLSRAHAVMENNVAAWLGVYRARTAGCEAMSNATWLMVDDSPQPDTSLRILPEHGGQSTTRGPFAAGAPEFLAEICLSSAAYDLHQKLDLYEGAGVREYLAVLVHEGEVRWHRRIGSRFEVLQLPGDSVYRSAVFPGLWLDAPALLAGDLAHVLSVVNDGIRSPEHQQFVEQLAVRRRA